MDEANLRSKRLAEDAVKRASVQSHSLIKMLRDENLVPTEEDQLMMVRDDAIKAYKHHWWVQLDDGNGVERFRFSTTRSDARQAFCQIATPC